MKNKTLLFVVIFLVLIGGGVGAFFLLRKKDDEVPEVPEMTPVEDVEPEITTGVTATVGTTTTAAPVTLAINADNAATNRVALIKEMEGYIDKLYKTDSALNTADSTWNKNISNTKTKAKAWAKSMFEWCRDNKNGWSFASQQEQADANGYPLSLQLVQSIAWQLHATAKLYNKAAWDVLADRIFNLV